jgi:hypothetical protein
MCSIWNPKGRASAALGGGLAEIARLGGGTAEGYPEETDRRTVSGSFRNGADRPRLQVNHSQLTSDRHAARHDPRTRLASPSPTL